MGWWGSEALSSLCGHLCQPAIASGALGSLLRYLSGNGVAQAQEARGHPLTTPLSCHRRLLPQLSAPQTEPPASPARSACNLSFWPKQICLPY